MDMDTDGPLLFPALDARGVSYDVVAWDDPKVKWNRYHTVVVRATWDYFRRAEQFLDVLEQIDQHATLLNPLEVIEWNLDKRYLIEVNKAGLPTVPSTYVSHLHPPTELASAMGQIGRWDVAEVVVKPTVSAGSNDTFRIDAADGSSLSKAVQAIVDSDRVAMIQPYLPAVDTYGERGFVYVNGSFDHAFAKAALLTQGDQTVDGLFVPEKIAAVEPTDAERAVAESVNGWLCERFGPVLYARIDLLPSEEGPQLVEVELIEPSLFFEADPPSAERFAEVLAQLPN